MKKIALITLFASTQMSFGQITKNMGDYNSLKVFDKLAVHIILGSENKIEITGKREQELEVVNNNGELKLRMPFPKLLSGDDVMINLYYTNLESIDVSEGATVLSEEIINQTNLSLNAKEGGQIILKIEVKNLITRAVSGGILILGGSAENQDASLGTGGILNADKLESEQTTIAATTGGKAAIRASEKVNAKVRTGGTINIYGKPKTINKDKMLGGKIIEKD